MPKQSRPAYRSAASGGCRTRWTSAITCAINPGSDPGKDKGLPKKAFEINYLTWLPDLGSNQGPTD